MTKEEFERLQPGDRVSKQTDRRHTFVVVDGVSGSAPRRHARDGRKTILVKNETSSRPDELWNYSKLTLEELARMVRPSRYGEDEVLPAWVTNVAPTYGDEELARMVRPPRYPVAPSSQDPWSLIAAADPRAGSGYVETVNSLLYCAGKCGTSTTDNVRSGWIYTKLGWLCAKCKTKAAHFISSGCTCVYCSKAKPQVTSPTYAAGYAAMDAAIRQRTDAADGYSTGSGQFSYETKAGGGRKPPRARPGVSTSWTSSATVGGVSADLAAESYRKARARELQAAIEPPVVKAPLKDFLPALKREALAAVLYPPDEASPDPGPIVGYFEAKSREEMAGHFYPPGAPDDVPTGEPIELSLEARAGFAEALQAEADAAKHYPSGRCDD